MRKIPLKSLKKLIIDHLGEGDEAYLFGSILSEYETYPEDVDLIIITETRKDFFSRVLEYIELKDKVANLDLIVYTPEEIKKMAGEGNPFICSILNNGEKLCGTGRGKANAG